jgi:hypothetical protein
MSDLDALSALAEAATPGPWKARTHPEMRVWSKQDGREYRYVAFGSKPDEEDGTGPLDRALADYIAAASPDVVLALIAEVRSLRKELDDVRRP